MKGNKAIIDSILQNRIISHFLFWLSFLILFTLLAILNSGTFKSHLVTYLAMLPAQIVAAYLFNYYQVPQLLLKKKYILFLTSMGLSIYLLSAIARWSVVYIAEPLIRKNFVQETFVEILSDFAYLFSIYFSAVYIYAFIMLGVKTIKKRFEDKHQLELMEKEKAIQELRFLKAQIQPHFLFNTLNNLYSLALDKSDQVPDVILKLSELLDFVLYQSNEKSIAISREIELIHGLIELESLRYSDRLNIVFNQNLEDENVQIAPFLLLPIVENAFKHGSDDHPEIRIDIIEANHMLRFTVDNKKPQAPFKKEKGKFGIGIDNLRRQLELHYPGAYQLEINDDAERHHVRLEINLRKL